MRDEEVMHVIRVLFLRCQNPLQQDTRGRVFLAEISDHFPIGFNGYPLGDEVLFDHFHQIVALDVLRSRSR